MTKEELDLILQKGEGYKIEFKENVNSDLSKEMIAFANSSGGRIFIGVNDDSQIIGIKKSNDLSSKIQDIAQNCDPSIPIHIIDFENIIILEIPEGLNKPYRNSKGFFIRNGANSQKMTTAEITSFLQTEGKVRFDEIVREDIDFDVNFDKKAFSEFIKLSSISGTLDPESLLHNLDSIVVTKGKVFFNNAGLLFFSKDPISYLFYCSVVCALYKGNEKLTILDRKELKGNLIQNVEDSLLFLKKHLNLRYEIHATRREEILEIPEIALRETVINSICHRDYFEKGAQVMIEIFDDRVEISNPGGLPKGLTPEKFGKRSIARNPIIANLFQRARFIEKMGTGINRIRQAMHEAALPDPTFEYDGYFVVTLYKKSVMEGGTEGGTEGGIEGGTEVDINLNISDKQKVVLSLIRENIRITIDEVATELGINRSAAQKHFEGLKEKGIIVRRGRRSGYWEIL
jgi:ATP-dependent DNA helicase RecG